ncbi:uncharacterized protein LOC144680024 isoform X2 [Cetorhinus maximus]
MGCSSSTQTQLQDSNRPSSKLEDRNGGSKCVPDVNGPIIDESETIPDQSQLLEAKELDTVLDEVVTSEPGPSEAVGVLEVAAEAGVSPVAAEVIADGPETSTAPMEATSPSDADVQPTETEEQTEGEIGEKLESKMNVDTGIEEVETKEEETEDTVPSEVTEMKSKED